MTFNLESEGFPIALIKGKKDKIVFLDENNQAENNYTRMRSKEGSKFQFMFNKNKERFVSYVCGQSGSGKSYWTGQLANEYKKMYPKRMIYLMSNVNEDASIDKIKDLKRIDIKKDEFLETDLDSSDFENSLVILDDVDCITEKKLKLKLRDLLTKLLQTGRHTNTSVIYLSHIACSGNDTKIILNECNSITFFPATLGGRAKDYLLKNYLSLNKKQIDKMEEIGNDTRSITITKSYPPCIITDKELIVVKAL